MKSRMLYISLALLSAACNASSSNDMSGSQQVAKAPISAIEPKTPSTAGPGHADAGEKEAEKDVEKEIQKEPARVMPDPAFSEEKVSPPATISGSYIFCDEIRDGNSALVLNIGCSLLDSSNNKANLSVFSSHQWTVIGAEQLEVRQSNTVGGEYHVVFDLKAKNADAVNQFKKKNSFEFSGTHVAGTFSDQTYVATWQLLWQRLTAGAIPTNALILGSENHGVPLALCRGFIGNTWVVGKLLNATATDSLCGISWQGNENLVYNGTQFGVEAFLMTKGSFQDVFEWVDASDGVHPDLAVHVGSKATVCRAKETGEGTSAQNDPGGEYIPGNLYPGESGCIYSYYGERKKNSYQVLSWKSAFVRDLSN